MGAEINRDEVLKLHEYTILRHGGAPGVRDWEALDSALQRPAATFLNQPLYKTAEEQASALLESLIKDRPFNDGNKRTAFLLYRLVLRHSGIDIHAGEDDKLRLLINIEDAVLKYGEIKTWTREHLRDF